MKPILLLAIALAFCVCGSIMLGTDPKTAFGWAAIASGIMIFSGVVAFGPDMMGDK